MGVLRFVRKSDVASILKIYESYILHTTITFEEEVPSLEEFRKRIQTISAEYPYLVCESAGVISGYAYAHRYQERASYRWNAELSVYVERGGLRKGTGRALYGALLELLRLQGIQNVYGIVTCPNENSEKLHEAFGFRKLGAYRQTGFKQGEWHDVELFEKSLGEHGANPAPPVPIGKLDPAVVSEVLGRYGQSVQCAQKG